MPEIPSDHWLWDGDGAMGAPAARLGNGDRLVARVHHTGEAKSALDTDAMHRTAAHVLHRRWSVLQDEFSRLHVLLNEGESAENMGINAPCARLRRPSRPNDARDFYSDAEIDAANDLSDAERETLKDRLASWRRIFAEIAELGGLDAIAERLDELETSLRDLLEEIFSSPLAGFQDVAALLDIAFEYDLSSALEASSMPELAPFFCALLRAIKAAAPTADFTALRRERSDDPTDAILVTAPLQLDPS